ncbi:MAG: hypothetical protein HY541_04105 [Deltaproteobacteria bacterium]|nr:hypothetical protein [Deltaproteobacteria bacterium]
MFVHSIWHRWCLALFFGFLIHCSGSSGGTDSEDEETETASADLAVFLEWSGSAWDSLVAIAEDDETLTFPVECPGGGTMDSEGDEVTINDCVVTSETGTTYLGRGAYTLTESGSLVTHEWDQDLIVDDDATFSSTGSVSFNTLEDLIAFDFSATFSSGVFRLTGTVIDNGNGTSDLTLSVQQDGEAWLDCSLDNQALDSLTDSLINAACADNEDAACDTLECGNDFQCQLFADDDPDDEFETGNVECSEGCCAIIEEVADCPESSSCTDDFSCQLFADDDPDDEFETDNVECGDDGCCALIE